MNNAEHYVTVGKTTLASPLPSWYCSLMTTSHNETERTMPTTSADYYPYVCTDVVCQTRKDAGQRCPWCWGGYPKS